MIGQIQNQQLDNGILTFNTADPLYLNAGIDIPIRLKRFSIIPSYRFQIREYSVTVINNQKNKIINEPFSNHLFNFTIKWHF